MNNYLMRAASKWLVPFFIITGFYLLFRGHNLPGGGFTGGLVFGSAFVIRYLSQQKDPNHYKLLFLSPEKVISAGLLLGLLSGLWGAFYGQPFLSAVWHFEAWIPLVGKTKFGTPFYFDIGVFLVVAGTLNKIFQVMELDQWKSY